MEQPFDTCVYEFGENDRRANAHPNEPRLRLTRRSSRVFFLPHSSADIHGCAVPVPIRSFAARAARLAQTERGLWIAEQERVHWLRQLGPSRHHAPSL